MRVRTDIGVLEGLELLRTEMIEEKERPYGLLFRGGQKTANLEVAHFPHSRAQYQDVSHFSRGAPPRNHLFTRCSSAQPSFHAALFRATINALAHH
jgi:hypothetical protein